MKKLLLLLLFTFPIIGLSQSSAYDKAENYFTEKIPNINTMLIGLHAENYSINSDKFKDYNNIKDVFSENDFSVNDEIIFYDSIVRFRNSMYQPTNPASNGFFLTVVTKLNDNDLSKFFHLYLKSDLAYLNITKGILIAKHNVRYTYNNTTLITEQLIWDMNKNLIYTELEVSIRSEHETIIGVGFQSTPDFIEFEVKKAEGVFDIESEKIIGDYYNPKGHPKAKGLNFQIKVPLGFEQTEGNRPNIVQKWTKNPTDNQKMVGLMIMVGNLPEENKNISQEDWKQYLKSESGREDYLSLMPNTSNDTYYVLDNYSGLYFESMVIAERTNLMYTKRVDIFLDEHMFSMQMMTNNKDLLEQNTKLFHLLANSVIFPDQYKN